MIKFSVVVNMGYLSSGAFATVVASTPLVSIDLIVRDSNGLVLLGERLNRPAQGYWFVPGGRILKDESLAVAFRRLTRTELGVEANIEEANYIGLFEHFYSDSVFCVESAEKKMSTHYVVNGFELYLPADHDRLPTAQHNKYRWFYVEELLKDVRVHKHTQWYFMPDKGIRVSI